MKKSTLCLAIGLAFPLFTSTAQAQGIATEAQLKPVEVGGTRQALDPNLPNSSASKTAEQLTEQNVFNPEDAFVYQPSTTIRKRYIGDRNGVVGGRSFGTLQTGRALVYLDGYLISSFLGRFDAPRWHMVNPEAIERVDSLYGPYSAIYPGNSIGTTMAITERKPKQFEGSIQVQAFRQPFSQYGSGDTYDGNQVTARLASRLDSGLWYSLGYNRQNVSGQPMSYATVSRQANGSFPAVTGTTTPVTGIVYDTDPQGRQRAVLGAYSIDHTTQDTYKARIGYQISPTLEIDALVSYWVSDSETNSFSLLKNAAGQPVWGGLVSDAATPANRFNLGVTLSPTLRHEENRQTGITLKTKHATGWNGSAVATRYAILSDVSRTSTTSGDPAVTALGGAGQATLRDGTGWNTFELQATYTPVKGDWGNGNHALVFGLHRNAYTLSNQIFNSPDWRAGQGGLAQSYSGNTEVMAWYAQDAWRLSQDVVATVGVRQERFQTADGRQYDASLPTSTVNYASKTIHATSPKLSLAWATPADWLLRASYGKGVRFANVDELYNAPKSGTTLRFSDPNLAPEKSNSVEFTAEKDWGIHALRATLFRDDVRDTITSQSDVTVLPTITRISNVDRIITNGIELVWQARDWLLRGLNLGANGTWVDAKVVENSRDPASVGKTWTRVPKHRIELQASYLPNAHWLFAAGYRFEGRAFNTTDNSDINPDVFGGVSRVSRLDVKVGYTLDKHWDFNVGIDNLNNNKAYQAHPYPQRTFYAGLRYKL